jgi:hypothetical protein
MASPHVPTAKRHEKIHSIEIQLLRSLRGVVVHVYALHDPLEETLGSLVVTTSRAHSAGTARTESVDVGIYSGVSTAHEEEENLGRRTILLGEQMTRGRRVVNPVLQKIRV